MARLRATRGNWAPAYRVNFCINACKQENYTGTCFRLISKIQRLMAGHVNARYVVHREGVAWRKDSGSLASRKTRRFIIYICAINCLQLFI